MIQGGERLCLAREPRQAIVIAGKSLVQDLDRHIATQRGVAGAVDLAHAARPERGQDHVRTEAGTGGEGHGGRRGLYRRASGSTETLSLTGESMSNQRRRRMR